MAVAGRKNVDEILLLSLAAGASVAAAAAQAKCCEKTVRRRLADADFRAKVHEKRSEMIGAAVGRLATLGTIAADELYRLIKSGKDDNVKLGAARAVLSNMLSGHEREVLVQQLAELRRKIEEMYAGHDPQRDSPPAGAGGTEGDGGAGGTVPFAG